MRGSRRRLAIGASQTVAERFPEIRDVEVPRRLSDNVTLSTMHGCPPEEIGSMSEVLLCERRLHTAVKLNPTLLGPARVRGILNERLGYETSRSPTRPSNTTSNSTTLWR